MKNILLAYLLLAIIVINVNAQFITIIPDGGNKKASVSEQIGITKVSIDYGRPGVKGREGHIWGTDIAHYGLKHAFGNDFPWRAGANENTVISFSDDVQIEGHHLPAGRYGLFMLLDETETTVIFSINSTSWGSFYYKDSEDALRVRVKNRALEKSVEWLKYEFQDQTDSTATVALLWEKRAIPFEVKVDLVKTHVASFERELRSVWGYAYQSYYQAARFCWQRNTHLDRALEWSDAAISRPYVGVRNFETLGLKASILKALGKDKESDVLLDEALQMGSMNEVHNYARALQARAENKRALEIFQLNFKKHPTEFTTLVGLGRGYSAVGNYKIALKYMNLALPKAPNDLNRNTVIQMIKKLEEGKDVN